MNCISSKKFVEFPALKQGRERKGKVRLSETIEIYCTCRMPKSFSQEMVQCDQCLKWFHLVTCVKVNQCDQKWYCDLCSVYFFCHLSFNIFLAIIIIMLAIKTHY